MCEPCWAIVGIRSITSKPSKKNTSLTQTGKRHKGEQIPENLYFQIRFARLRHREWARFIFTKVCCFFHSLTVDLSNHISEKYDGGLVQFFGLLRSH